MKTRVLLVDNHRIVLDGLTSIFAGDEMIEVVGRSTDGKSAQSLAEKLKPDILITELGLPMVNGFMLIQSVKAALPSCKIMVLTAYDDCSSVLRAHAFGAVAYLLKSETADELRYAVRHVSNGNAWFSPSISKMIFDHF